MSGDAPAPDLLPRKFAPSSSDRSRWRRNVEKLCAGRTFILLKQIEIEWAAKRFKGEGAASVTWLLKYRADLRWAIQFSLLEPIKLYLADCRPEMTPLGVWLWGKCADRFRLYGLSAFCHDPSPKVRKHVAKALRRLEAWALLNEMAASYPDDAIIQWYATAPTTTRPFAERLEIFMSNVDVSHADEVASPSQMTFWAQATFWSRTPPKSVLLIRRMLRRIQHWVRGGRELNRRAIFLSSPAA